MIVVADSGGANIASVLYALDRLGVTACVSADPDEVARAERVILPGVGAAADAMRRLHKTGLAETIRALDVPVLGICLGMQLLFDGSDEGGVDCLGVIPGVARRFDAGQIVPHMGWAPVSKTRDCALLDGIDDGAFFYFVHSYALPVGPTTVATADHGGPFAAIAQHRNFFAAQCHPERSAQAGATLLGNFLRLPVEASTCT